MVSESFVAPVHVNLYSLILGLSEDVTNPDHYQILGLPRFTSDLQAISEAAVSQNRKLLKWQNSDYFKDSLRLIQEIVEAKQVLENPETRRQYDRQFQENDPTDGLESLETTSETLSFKTQDTLAELQSSPLPRPRDVNPVYKARRERLREQRIAEKERQEEEEAERQGQKLVLAGFGGLVVIVVLGMIVYRSTRSRPPVGQVEASTPERETPTADSVPLPEEKLPTEPTAPLEDEAPNTNVSSDSPTEPTPKLADNPKAEAPISPPSSQVGTPLPERAPSATTEPSLVSRPESSTGSTNLPASTVAPPTTQAGTSIPKTEKTPTTSLLPRRPTDIPGIREGTPQYAAVDLILKVSRGDTDALKSVIAEDADGLLKKLRSDDPTIAVAEAKALFGNVKPLSSRLVDRDTVVSFKNDENKILQFYVRRIQGEYVVRDIRVREAVDRTPQRRRRR